MKRSAKIVSALLTLSILFSWSLNVFAYEKTELESAISSGISFYKDVQKPLYEADPSLKGTPFHAMMRAETAMLSRQDYLFLVPSYDINSVSKYGSVREYANMIIICVMSGIDPSTVITGLDVVDKLIDMQNKDGMFYDINSDTPSYEDLFWAMIALDLLNAEYNRAEALNAVERIELSTGGFANLEEENPDIELTALATIALSRYTNPRAVDMKNRSTSLLKESYQDGKFAVYGEGEESNVVTHSMCVIALIAAGEQIWNEPYSTDENDPIQYILNCQDESGGFWYSPEYKQSPSGEHKTVEDYASAVAMCAIIDAKNTRSYILNVGEKFYDNTHSDLVPEPEISGFEIKYVLGVGTGLVVFIALIFIFALFSSGTDQKKRKKVFTNRK